MGYLDAQGVTKTYGASTALHPLNLTLERGELVTLLGPSGCGKTTLLRIIAGFTPPSAGRVIVDGRDVTQLPAARRAFGMVFQAYSLFPNLTAEDNVAFGLRVRGAAPAARKQRLDELFELIGLQEVRGRYPHQLSGGQQQRVALARALAIQPRVLLLDEPLSALDARVRVALRDEIRRVQRETGTTTVFVTHDQEEALAISDRVVVMEKGRVVQAGRPEDIYRRPATPFVAEFVGTASALTATVTDATRGLVQVEGWPAGAPFELPAARGRAPGSRLRLYLRPEDLRLGDGPDALDAEVLDKRFLGSITRLRLRLGETVLAADLPGDEAERHVAGDRVRVLPPRSAHLLDAPDAVPA